MFDYRNETFFSIYIDVMETERAIFFINQNLAHQLNLKRVSAPLFLDSQSGMQDNLNGYEKPVTFKIAAIENKSFEIVHSLAKWKRYALARYRIPEGEGIYTDMNAIRPDEEDLSSALHSVYVDQWDWEKVIPEGQRNISYLRETVEKIYNAILETEKEVAREFGIEPVLPQKIVFQHCQDLAREFPQLTPRQREQIVAEKFRAVFLIGIGGELADGKPHDGRAPDYDDWSTPTDPQHNGLNGDIILWHPVLNKALEISSMGIRVNREALIRQCYLKKCPQRLKLPWHKMLLQGKLPQSIGGGIGQSRLCMYLLRKRHIGEVQVGAWPEEVLSYCAASGIELL